MEKHSRLVKFAAVATTLIVLATSTTKRVRPLVDEKYTRTEKAMLVPIADLMQPRTIVLRPTEKIALFIEDLKKTNKNVDWGDGEATGIFLTGLITKIKETRDPAKEMNEYLKGAAGQKELTPDSLFEDRFVSCTQRSAALAAALKFLGFKANLMMLDENYSASTAESHMFVVLETNKGFLYLDPKYNLWSYNIEDYAAAKLTKNDKKAWVKNVYVYPLVPYSEEFSRRHSAMVEGDNLSPQIRQIDLLKAP